MIASCEGIITEAGPIKHWWDENWDTPEHWAYDEWREALNAGLVAAGFLVYRPHHAFKGAWDERAQSVNDTALRVSDAILNLTPPGVPSLGTDGELLYAANFDGVIVPAPPVENHEQGVAAVIAQLKSLNIRRDTTPQEIVRQSLLVESARLGEVTSFVDEHDGSVLRVHFYDEVGRIEVIDAAAFSIKSLARSLDGQHVEVSLTDVLKIEALARQV